ncbi:FAD-dependent monooxygenase [Streptomyces ficellus]|uniref:FAD-dependent monooxygenase n=1 Tax=Streptomyces ficellus TaxID=1977088 RepID=UPI001FCC299A|nr:FAD-dependent monooxygenase [Streptomyces ficellus]
MTGAVDVLVVGAGPTGLTLALQAHCHGARVRVVERRPEAFRPSRALILHPRTLEALRPLGVTDALLGLADTAPTVGLHLGPQVVRAGLADLALPDTAFPHLSLIRQADVERVLATALAGRGVEVERGTELVAVREGRHGADAVLRSRTGTDMIRCPFVAGCDGPASTVRACAGIGWYGRPYAVEAVLADIDLSRGSGGDGAEAFAGRQGLLLLFPLGEQAAWRLLATRASDSTSGPSARFGQPGPAVPRAELQQLLSDAGTDARIERLVWSARVPLQYRLARRFRRGRLFLLGDAAHNYSPATGQGMNAGIQDAVNLGWKLGFAIGAAEREPADQLDTGALLDSYDRERRPVACRRLLLTHAAFWAEASTGRVPSWLRAVAAPHGAPVVPVLLDRRRLVAEGIRVISQLRVDYRRSPLSVKGAPRLRGAPHPGDRLPDATVSVGGPPRRLHDLLARPGVHLLLQRDAEPLPDATHGPYLDVLRLMNSPGRGLMAVRPDGHVGFTCGAPDVAGLNGWLGLIGAAETWAGRT